jgi:2-phosphoglycerate kinase
MLATTSSVSATPNDQAGWHVLLLGGASGVGKTTLAYLLGERYGVNVAQLDDIATALETITTPDQQPLIHFWRTNWTRFSQYTDEQHVDHFLDVCRQVYSPVLEAVIASHLDGGMPTLIEGDFILPELAARSAYGGQPNDGRVRALFLLEHEEAQIASNVVDRQGGDATLPARTSWLKNRWLQQECDRLGLPTVAARPWATVTDRAHAAVFSQ